MPAGGRNLQRALDLLLALDVGEVGVGGQYRARGLGVYGELYSAIVG